MSTTLSKAQIAALNRASQPAVTRAAGEVGSRFLPHSRWIGTKNRYRSDVLDRLSDDLSSRAPDARQLAQYVAASSFHHCADGWSFLGRAIGAHLSGDAETARHLGYYAELRAAVGILATHGIGVFNNVHVVLEAGSTVRLFRGPGTHVMTWLTLPQWACRQEATATLARIVSPYRVPLDVWASALPNVGPFRPIAEGWLNLWGLDLQTLALDRDSRNESSYQPSRINGRRAIDPQEATKFAVELWSLLEPASQGDPFPVLDLQLLRLGLEGLRVAAGHTPSGPDWEVAVRRTIEDAVGDPSPPGLEELLLRSETATAADSPIFEHAARVLPVRDPRHHLGVLARALLLLRVCSGCIGDLAASAGVSESLLRFWHEELALDRGIWPGPPLPEPITDLYSEVGACIDSLRVRLAGGAAVTSYMDLRTSEAEAMLALGGCERVAVWSTGA